MKTTLQKFFGIRILVLVAAVMVMFLSQCKKDSMTKPAAKGLEANGKKDTICCLAAPAAKSAIAKPAAKTAAKDTICCLIN